MKSDRGLEKSKSDGKNQTATLKEKIIALKLFNPKLKARIMAEQLGTTTNYVYKTWSNFIRREVKLKGRAREDSGGWRRGEPLVPFHVHGWFFYNQVPSSWYRRCPYGVVDNRNRLKLCRTRLFTFCIYPSGSVFVYPFFRELTNWKELLREKLSSWLERDEVELFMDSLSVMGRKEFAFKTPNVPRNLCIRVKGLGSFKTDTTPYPDGTTEYVVDPGFEKRLSVIERNMDEASRALKILPELVRISESQKRDIFDLKSILVELTKISTVQAETLETFRAAMQEHLAMIKTIQKQAEATSQLVSQLVQVADALRGAVEELKSRRKRRTVKREGEKPKKERKGLLNGLKEWWRQGYQK